MSSRPLCFVLMPFGVKSDEGGLSIDFDRVYAEIISPAIRDAHLEPLRADEEFDHGIVHKPMFERLLLCEYAVADVTLANANVYYELGIRHAVRPMSTVLIGATDRRLPFDVELLRVMQYQLGPDGMPTAADDDRSHLCGRLERARSTDSPVYQLVGELRPPETGHLRPDVFRERIEYVDQIRGRLKAAGQSRTIAAIASVEGELGPLAKLDVELLIALVLAYKRAKAWTAIVRVIEATPPPVGTTPLLREQYAFALNQSGDHLTAESVLLQVLEDHGPSSETYGLLGSVYKNLWLAARDSRTMPRASGYLKRAIDTYLRGFEADCRDCYPGINAVTLMRVGGVEESRVAAVLPVVRYAALLHANSQRHDYWSHATLLELAVLEEDEHSAAERLGDALACSPDDWQIQSTLRNLELLREAQQRLPWLDEMCKSLQQTIAPK